MKKLTLAWCRRFSRRCSAWCLPPRCSRRTLSTSTRSRPNKEHAAGGMKMGAGMMDEMAAKKKANTERIAALMAQVKSSTGDVKVAAMADVINVLLEERAAMGEHCATMMSMMKK